MLSEGMKEGWHKKCLTSRLKSCEHSVNIKPLSQSIMVLDKWFHDDARMFNSFKCSVHEGRSLFRLVLNPHLLEPCPAFSRHSVHIHWMNDMGCSSQTGQVLVEEKDQHRDFLIFSPRLCVYKTYSSIHSMGGLQTNRGSRLLRTTTICQLHVSVTGAGFDSK